MPKTIPCYDCKGKGTKLIKYKGMVRYTQAKCKTCGGCGVLSVYTQAELDEAVKTENEACAMTCENRLYQNWKECAEAIIRARSK